MLDIPNLLTGVPYGYIFEVDLVYPVEFHDKHNDNGQAATRGSSSRTNNATQENTSRPDI